MALLDLSPPGDQLPTAEQSGLDMHPFENKGVFFEESSAEPRGKQATVVLEGYARADRFNVHWQAEFPENLAYYGLLHFVNGFGATEASSEAFMHAASQEGYATVISEPVRKDNGRAIVRFKDPQRAHAESLEAVAADIRRSPVIRKKAPNSNQVDRDRKTLVPHSMGGLPAAQYAEWEPDAVEAIFNLATCGYGPPTAEQVLRKLPSGLFGTVVHEIVPAIRQGYLRPSWRSARKEAEYFFTDVTRPLCEGRSCIREDVTERALRLRARGVLIAWLGFEYDFLVPPTASIAKYVDIYKVMLGAGHMAPQRKPDQVMREQFIPIHNRLIGAA